MSYILHDPSIFGISLTPFDVHCLSVEAFADNFLPVRWAICKGISTVFVYQAAEVGNIKCLEYLKSQIYEWNESTCDAAASNGHIDCLKYIHENGSPWNEWTCIEAARYGQLDCLIYLHEEGCPWDEETCEYAAGEGAFRLP